MSTGHLHGDEKGEAELYEMLGEGDTAKLYARKAKLDTSCDIPYGGGVSVDGKRPPRADMVVLNANPLDAIRNIRSVRWTIRDGRVYDAPALWQSVRFQP